jgi:uncharacterized protein YdeI (YjbR/CyaY-like superfamily)
MTVAYRPAMADIDDGSIVAFPSERAWDEWLAAHHASSPGVWMRIARAGSGVESVSHPEALDVAIRYGWIDAQKRAHDEAHWLQRFTPRAPRSRWSKVNRAKAEDLIARRLMREAGMREVEKARADGRWEAAYEPQRTATVPDDLGRALAANDRAAGLFASLDSRNRYAILHRIESAKRPETRARRIAQYVDMLAEGRTIHPMRRRGRSR